MFILYLLLTILNINFSKNEKLVFVENIFRHGARGPNKLNDSSQDQLGIKWNSPAELTPIGKRMEYILGLYNRKKYITGKNKFLSERFDPHELIVYSTNINRTLLSVTSQLQGLYPISSETGEKLTNEQYNASFPPVNITYEDFLDEINMLNDSALPNYMTIIPIHHISLTNTSINCSLKFREILLNNSNMTHIVNFVNDFNRNYSVRLNEYYGKEKNFTYTFGMINSIFDDLVADLTEGNNVSEFFKTNNIDEQYFTDIRYEILKIHYRDLFFGDENAILSRMYVSVALDNMINHMKRKIDDDINGNPSVKNISDFSRPKMVIISGHDTTLSSLQIFFIKFFNLGIDKFIYPIYASQMNFEIARDDDDTVIKEKGAIKNLKYSDYKVSYYFNDKLIMNKTLDKFIEIIEKNIWNSEQIYNYCIGENKEDNIDASLIIIMLMGVIIIILAIVIIILVSKLRLKSDAYSASFSKDAKLINDDKEE